MKNFARHTIYRGRRWLTGAVYGMSLGLILGLAGVAPAGAAPCAIEPDLEPWAEATAMVNEYYYAMQVGLTTGNRTSDNELSRYITAWYQAWSRVLECLGDHSAARDQLIINPSIAIDAVVDEVFKRANACAHDARTSAYQCDFGSLSMTISVTSVTESGPRIIIEVNIVELGHNYIVIANTPKCVSPGLGC